MRIQSYVLPVIVAALLAGTPTILLAASGKGKGGPPAKVSLVGKQITGPFIGCKNPQDVRNVVGMRDDDVEKQAAVTWKVFDGLCRVVWRGVGKVVAVTGMMKAPDGGLRCIVQVVGKISPWNEKFDLYLSITNPPAPCVVERERTP